MEFGSDAQQHQLSMTCWYGKSATEHALQICGRKQVLESMLFRGTCESKCHRACLQAHAWEQVLGSMLFRTMNGDDSGVTYKQCGGLCESLTIGGDLTNAYMRLLAIRLYL